MPVEVQPSASVSRAGGTAAWVTATEAISVGAMARPLRISSPADGSTGAATNGSGSSERASRRSRSGTAAPERPPGEGAGDHPGDQRAGGPGHHDRAGVRQDARLAGEGDDDDLHAAEEDAEGHGGDDDGSSRRADSRLDRLRRSARLAGGRLGAALRGEGERADQADDPAGGQAQGRVDRGGQEGDQHRTDDEDDLVQHGLEGEGGVQQRGAAQPVAPARADGGPAEEKPRPTPTAVSRGPRTGRRAARW